MSGHRASGPRPEQLGARPGPPQLEVGQPRHASVARRGAARAAQIAYDGSRSRLCRSRS